MDTDKIGKFLAQVRKEKGLTQKQLAKKIDVSDKAISRWETGKGLPEVSSITLLCETLDISVTEFLNGQYSDKKEDEMNVRKMIDYSKISIDRKVKVRRRKIILCFIVIVLIGIFFVNPIYNDHKAKSEVVNYINKKFGFDNNYEMELEDSNSFSREYIFHVYDPNLIDESFYVHYDDKRIYDDYEDMVVNKAGVLIRLQDEYTEDIWNFLEKEISDNEGISIGIDSNHTYGEFIEVASQLENNMEYTRKIDQTIDFVLEYRISYKDEIYIDYDEAVDKLISLAKIAKDNGFHIKSYSLTIVSNPGYLYNHFENITEDMLNDDLPKLLQDAKDGVSNGINYIN